MMASRKERYESSQSVSKNAGRHVGEVMFSSSSDEEEVTSGCRSCKNTSTEYFTKNHVETDPQPGTSQDTSRTRCRGAVKNSKQNQLSFKRFIKNGSQVNYQKAGARPKIYSSPTPNPCDSEKGPGPYNLEKIYSRNPTELPDFVQDHLVIEQYYLNHELQQQAISDIDNLPDFALNSVERRKNLDVNEAKISRPIAFFTATENLDDESPYRNQSGPESSGSPHLSAFRSNARLTERPEPSGFPLDLPLLDPVEFPHTEANEGNVPKSLPDFLNDGPIHNRTTISTESGSIPNSVESTERRLLAENELLGHELEEAYKQINEKTERIRLLEEELASRKEVEHEETIHLEKAMEQVEDNLKRSTRRVVNAENTVSSLKKEIKCLTTKISLLQLENSELKAGIAMSSKNEYGSSNVDQTVRRLASDLRTAASSAEVSLRQLMSGVDNLRVLASALENMDRIEDRTKDFVPDFDEDNAAGPAL